MVRPFFLFFLIFFAAWSSTAQPANSDKKDEGKWDLHDGEAEPDKPKTLEDKLRETKEPATKFIDSASKTLDLYLAGEKLTKEKNKSSVILKNSFYWSEGGEVDNGTHFDVKLHLPNLETKWALRFTSYDEDEDERGINRRRIRTGPSEENYGASLAFFETLGDFDVTFRPKVQIKDSVTTSHLIKIDSRGKAEKFQLRPRLELFAREDTGTGELFGLDLYFELSKTFMLVLVNEEEYVDYENLFSTNHELSLNQNLEDRMNLKYAALYESSDKPHFRLQSYTFYVSFGHTLFKDLLRYGITPRLEFKRTEKFEGDTGLTLSLDLIF